MTTTIDDYSSATIYTSSKCPICKQVIENLQDYLTDIVDKACTIIACPHCDSKVEVRCLVTVDCYVAREGDRWFMGVGASKRYD